MTYVKKYNQNSAHISWWKFNRHSLAASYYALCESHLLICYTQFSIAEFCPLYDRHFI